MFGWLIGRPKIGAAVVDPEADEDVWRRASLQYLESRLCFVAWIWPQQSEVDWAVKRLAEARPWVSAIKDSKMRRHCESWCEYAQYCIDKAQEELRTKQQAREIIDRVRATEQDADVESEGQGSR